MIEMLRSMTGYGHSEGYDAGALFRVDIRSVNHRFQEIMVRMPRELVQLEELVKKEVQSTFTRGRLDVLVAIEPDETTDRQAKIDWKFAEQVMQLVHESKERFGLSGEMSVSDFVLIPDMLAVQEIEANVEAWRQPLLRVVREACAALLEMRILEGQELAKDLMERVENVREHVAKIRSHAPKVIESYRERLSERVRDFLRGVEVDEGRLLTEVALYAEKSNIDEELIRLDSHCKQFRHILSFDEPSGRKLDFLVQEMNREINTVGSKANDLAISQAVVEVKSELEKIREQVQNVE